MFAEAMKLSLMEEYQAWNYMAADNTKQIGGYLKKFDRLSWITVKGAVSYNMNLQFSFSFNRYRTVNKEPDTWSQPTSQSKPSPCSPTSSTEKYNFYNFK